MYYPFHIKIFLIQNFFYKNQQHFFFSGFPFLVLLLILIFCLKASSLHVIFASKLFVLRLKNFSPILLNKSSIPCANLAEVDLNIAFISLANSFPSVKLTTSNS